MKLNRFAIEIALAGQALSASAFAEKIGIPRSVFSHAMTEKNVSTITVNRIAKGLGVTIRSISAPTPSADDPAEETA
jgi:hypothetical protein